MHVVRKLDHLTEGLNNRRAAAERQVRVGVVGTGFIAHQLSGVARRMGDLRVTRVLTRRPIDSCRPLPGGVPVTQSAAELIDHSDVIVECTGDVLHATRVVGKALRSGRPVVTMNSEFHVTCGSYFVGKGYLTEAEGDQPGVTAALREDALAMGFEPLVYGNVKGFLNLDPRPDEMAYWSERQGIATYQTTSFTDGTKVQIEQTFVANGFGVGIAKTGLLAIESKDFDGAVQQLAIAADELGFPISDFVVSPGQAPGVFIVGKHDEARQADLRYLKMGNGPYYTLIRPFHLCAFEIPKTVRRVVAGKPPLLDNSLKPKIGVAAVAKTDLRPGDKIKRGVGSFEVRGAAVRMVDAPDHCPIGIIQNATVVRRVKRGEIVTVDHLDLPDSEARDIALDIVRRAVH